jgi:hypothetical protein
MARDGCNRGRGVVCSVSKEIQTKLGILAVSLEQCVMDCLGIARWCVCPDLSAGLPRIPECQRIHKESRAVRKPACSRATESEYLLPAADDPMRE